MTQPCLFDRAGGAVRVKICGLTVADEAFRTIELGADAIGVNFWPKSKRYIAPAAAAPWLRELAGVAPRIGVFVNEPIEAIARLLDEGIIDAAQLHGDESPADVGDLLARGFSAYKAVGVKDRAALDAAGDYPGDVLLLDAYAPSTYGGTGETLDWALGREAVERWPGRRIVLAGGLTPENVAEAARQANPAAVDVASGVESGTPGRKDMAKVAAFLAAARPDSEA
ncbi:MAG: phosphoribosylanthranilate isomerase [Verrucomicrobiae bacterium]|nr:phosphoribosylanthranilate isomerase [Verrucomicrobiae bacterium]MCP5539476.1 phosphoribosylanthranilate isomerase [Akkermansiaceae bacterium]MCP5551704.1 phosphoribosylanthranilate isomerase [Akkermansiaceae bacterium]